MYGCPTQVSVELREEGQVGASGGARSRDAVPERDRRRERGAGGARRVDVPLADVTGGGRRAQATAARECARMRFLALSYMYAAIPMLVTCMYINVHVDVQHVFDGFVLSHNYICAFC